VPLFPRTTAEEFAMKVEALKIGELGQRTGLTVRALHHYDDIGLLKPSLHTESGHRLYTVRDLARLQQIVSLRQLGFSLEQIRECLQRHDFSPLEVIGMHAARLREQIERQQRLCERLDVIAAHLRAAGDVSADEFLSTIEGMTMIESYYTPEQMEYLKERREQVGDGRIQQVQKEWPELIAQVKAEMQKGTVPTAPEVLELARRWTDLINEFTGGDQGIERSVGRLWKEQGDDLIARHGTEYDSRDVFAYIGQAIAVLKGSG
jgi:MerR family transcriptional regulator, thiopeptide resistance regulator